jgi:hypothetical protein
LTIKGDANRKSMTERQGLLHDHANDGPIERSYQLQGRDLFQLLHRHRVDDKRNDHRRNDEQKRREEPDLAPRPVDQRPGQKLPAPPE